MRCFDASELVSKRLNSIHNSDFFGGLGFFLGDVFHLYHTIENFMLAFHKCLVPFDVIGIVDRWVVGDCG